KFLSLPFAKRISTATFNLDRAPIPASGMHPCRLHLPSKQERKSHEHTNDESRQCHDRKPGLVRNPGRQSRPRKEVLQRIVRLENCTHPRDARSPSTELS